MTTPQEKIQEMLDKCATGRYIFRGENDKDYGKISSGLYRQYCQPDGNSSTNENGPLIDNEHFFVSSVEQDIVEKAKQHIRPGAPDMEVLTELQHYGGKTALLDFSKDLHIALFFACDGRFDRNGRIIFLETSGLTESTEIDYDRTSGDRAKHTLISPTGKNPRVIFQSSIFVHVPKGYLEGGYNIIEIEKDLKEPLLDYLGKHFNIKTETIYNDIQGFIRNQNNYSTAEIEFYRGTTNSASKKHEEAIKNYTKAIEINPQLDIIYYNRGLSNFILSNYKDAITDYTKAIEINPQYANAYCTRGNAKSALDKPEDAITDYTKAIELDPQLAEAYSNRGSAKSVLGKPEDAITDYNKAIELNPQDAVAYSNRGNTNLALDKPEDAITDYTKAIELNPQNAVAYSNLGSAKSVLGRHEDAITDYNKAIKIDPRLALAYYNRGKTNLALDKPEEAIEDYNQAKTLFAKVGNMEMVKKCEEIIAHLENL